ncbi:hypothetical protein [Bradyrhizobium sp. LA2.1]|uniref:hypothetical protein n=1 Tax=Bradyrhizobium sp. LA2.1 TaxID=3156376 RepID=UPI0033980F06
MLVLAYIRETQPLAGKGLILSSAAATSSLDDIKEARAISSAGAQFRVLVNRQSVEVRGGPNEMEFIFFATLWFIMSGIMASAARARGRSDVGWLAFAIFLSPLGAALALAFLPNLHRERQEELRHMELLTALARLSGDAPPPLPRDDQPELGQRPSRPARASIAGQREEPTF